MAYLGGFDPSNSLRTSEVRCRDYTTQHASYFEYNDEMEVYTNLSK